MSSKDRQIRQQKIRHAEGFLDLATACGNLFDLKIEHKKLLSKKALDCLKGLEESKGRRAHIFYLIGQAHRLVEDYDAAIESLHMGLEFDSNNVHIYLSLGWCYKRTGHLGSAITALERAREVESDSGIVNYNLACYWALAENPKKAVQFLNRAFEIDESFRDLIADEKDFDLIREDQDFLSITSLIG